MTVSVPPYSLSFILPKKQHSYGSFFSRVISSVRNQKLYIISLPNRHRLLLLIIATIWQFLCVLCATVVRNCFCVSSMNHATQTLQLGVHDHGLVSPTTCFKRSTRGMSRVFCGILDRSSLWRNPYAVPIANWPILPFYFYLLRFVLKTMISFASTIVQRIGTYRHQSMLSCFFVCFRFICFIISLAPLSRSSYVTNSRPFKPRNESTTRNNSITQNDRWKTTNTFTFHCIYNYFQLHRRTTKVQRSL